MKLYLVLAALFILGLAACGGPGGPAPTPNPTPVPSPTPTPTPVPGPTPGPSATPNNSVVLSGTALGRGTTPNSQLRKELGAGLTGESTAFRLGKAYATRGSATSETLYWFVAITNQSDSLRCFIRARELELKDSANRVLVTETFAFVGVSRSTGTYTNTCLNSRETGYFFGIELEDITPAIYSSVSSVSISGIEDDSDFDAPTARIIPQSYSALEPQGFTVTARNEGTGAARVSNYSSYFLLDENNLPLFFGYFDGSLDAPPVINVGETAKLNNTYFFYDGLTTKVQPQIDFTSPTDTSSTEPLAFSASMPNTEAAKKQYVAWRNQREQTKRNLVEKLGRAH